MLTKNMRPQLLLFGGTTQGRLLSQELSARGIYHFYSTKTVVSYQPAEGSFSLIGPLDAIRIVQFCHDHAITLIADASHPFAENLHQELNDASQWSGIPLIRLERDLSERVEHSLVKYVNNFDAASDAICSSAARVVLAATGVNTILKLKRIWTDRGRRTIFRVLDSVSSREQAAAMGLLAEDVLCMPAPLSAAHELALLRQLRAEAVITKESGNDGGLQYKISACIAYGIPIYIVSRPALPVQYAVVNGIEPMIDRIVKLCAP